MCAKREKHKNISEPVTFLASLSLLPAFSIFVCVRVCLFTREKKKRKKLPIQEEVKKSEEALRRCNTVCNGSYAIFPFRDAWVGTNPVYTNNLPHFYTARGYVHTRMYTSAYFPFCSHRMWDWGPDRCLWGWQSQIQFVVFEQRIASQDKGVPTRV